MSEELSADESALVLMAVREDSGPFEPLGGQFSCNKAGWFGKAVASPTAIYLLKKTKNNQGYGGGLVGVMLTAALAKEDKLSTCTVGDLPEPVRVQLDPKGKLGKKDVVIIPKATVSMVKGGGWNNSLKIQAGSDTFTIATSLFSMFAKPRALRAMGWELNTALTPTAAPVHDMRSEAERATADKPMWQKVLLVIGAIGVVIAVIAIRVIART
jgi:hypothetical protein